MTLDELLDVFTDSSKEDWHVMDCWRAPSYRDRFEFYDTYAGEPNALLHQQHGYVASYKENLAISIAWGIDTLEPKIDKPWATSFPDSSPASISYLDFFYNGALVFRARYCVVDGGRSMIPYPSHDGPNIYIPEQYYKAVKKLHEISHSNKDFDHYFEQSGMKTIDEKWV